jgi:hypothetical protein
MKELRPLLPAQLTEAFEPLSKQRNKLVDEFLTPMHSACLCLIFRLVNCCMFNIIIIEMEERLSFYFSIRHFILTSNTDAWNYFTTKGTIAHGL